jgi:hypothetical protein
MSTMSGLCSCKHRTPNAQIEADGRIICAIALLSGELADVYPKYGIRMVVAPVPISLPVPLGRAIPIGVSVMPLLPIYMPSTIFMFIKIVVVLVTLVVDVVTIIMVIIVVPIVILRHQIHRDEQSCTQRQYQQSSFHCFVQASNPLR